MSLASLIIGFMALTMLVVVAVMILLRRRADVEHKVDQPNSSVAREDE